jgi:mobilization protein NikA
MARSPSKKTTRRRKPAAQRKSDLIRIRVTEEQRQLFTDAAEREGLDLSSWLRRVGLKAAGAPQKAGGDTAVSRVPAS